MPRHRRHQIPTRTSPPSATDLEADLKKAKEITPLRNGLKLPSMVTFTHAAPPFVPNIPSIDDCSPSLRRFLLEMVQVTMYFLFEFARGYALFEAHGLNELDWLSFESTEKYINRSDQIFRLEAFLPFSSPQDALVQMNAISESIVTKELKKFLEQKLPKPMTINGRPNYVVVVFDPFLGENIGTKTNMSNESGDLCFNITRGLRMKIDKFIDDLKPGDLEKAQVDLARLYSRQRCTTMCTESSMAVSSSSLQEVVVVPHILEGVFIVKGNEDLICTKNLVPGEALHGEELYVQNEDGTEVEYRVWNPLRSKLAVAIVCGVTNIWIKPGSRVLCLGDECGITVSHLSDLVGLDGLVYAVGLSDVVVNMAEKRSNVVPIFENCYEYWKYRMVVGMVDVIFADIVYSDQVNYIVTNAISFLRAGGHYMISTTASKDPLLDHHERREFKPIELVTLEPRERAYAMAVGGFRMLEE